MARLGRPTKVLPAAEGDIVGLYKVPGKGHRWRITLKGPHFGQRFTEADERLAIMKFRQIIQADRPMVTLPLGAPVAPGDIDAGPKSPPTHTQNVLAAAIESVINKDGKVQFVQRIDEQALWDWAREKILADPVTAAARLGIPQIASLHSLPSPNALITLAEIASTYTAKSESTGNTKSHTRTAIAYLRDQTKAVTLHDLTTENLLKFRDAVVGEYAPSGAAAIFGKIKSALAFGLKQGLDAAQLNATLGRMKVLSAPRNTAKSNPAPITAGDFRKLLAAASPHWRIMLLLGLNMAMYLEDLCGLQWTDFDLEAGTYVGVRGKTQVIRVGVLWPESLDALKALPRTDQSPWVFTSRTGSRYLSHTQHDLFFKFRCQAEVEAPFSSLRDAAYTIACRTCEDRYSRVFAGHRMPGLMDSYIQRNPGWVKPASDAVYKAFAPFPKAAAV